jgi:hypothetical protein
MSLSWWNCWAQTKRPAHVTRVFIFPFACGAQIFQGHRNLLISVIRVSRHFMFWIARFVCRLLKFCAGGYTGIGRHVHTKDLMLVWRLQSRTSYCVMVNNRRFGRTSYLSCPKNWSSSFFRVGSKYASNYKLLLWGWEQNILRNFLNIRLNFITFYRSVLLLVTALI